MCGSLQRAEAHTSDDEPFMNANIQEQVAKAMQEGWTKGAGRRAGILMMAAR